jgi:hypothetical protein
LLARAVLLGQTKGYVHHPQLLRFRSSANPGELIDSYLHHVLVEAGERGYSFSRDKITADRSLTGILKVTTGQLSLERYHLMQKLAVRSLDRLAALPLETLPHPLFTVVEGPVESWERVTR